MCRPIGLVGRAIAGGYFDGDSPKITTAIALSANYELAEFSSADRKPLHPSEHNRFNPTRGAPKKPIHRRQEPAGGEECWRYPFWMGRFFRLLRAASRHFKIDFACFV